MKRAYKYCGGCNPRYDRKQAIEELQNKIGDTITYAAENTVYDELYVICGCSAACADISSLRAQRIIMITDW